MNAQKTAEIKTSFITLEITETEADELRDAQGGVERDSILETLLVRLIHELDRKLSN